YRLEPEDLSPCKFQKVTFFLFKPYKKTLKRCKLQSKDLFLQEDELCKLRSANRTLSSEGSCNSKA
ncbi:hypothetical protein, partial [Ileibacterium valens]|uniref:hypothetical protein n=1 Tax=Ileibacterium valens TaxID=1862668 RepID=UPI002570787E